jgi:hypothetical protein
MTPTGHVGGAAARQYPIAPRARRLDPNELATRDACSSSFETSSGLPESGELRTPPRQLHLREQARPRREKFGNASQNKLGATETKRYPRRRSFHLTNQARIPESELHVRDKRLIQQNQLGMPETRSATAPRRNRHHPIARTDDPSYFSSPCAPKKRLKIRRPISRAIQQLMRWSPV